MFPSYVLLTSQYHYYFETIIITLIDHVIQARQQSVRCGYRHVGHRQNHLRQSIPHHIQKLAATRSNLYTVNLDPAVKVVPYQPFLDIRDTH